MQVSRFLLSVLKGAKIIILLNWIWRILRMRFSLLVCSLEFNFGKGKVILSGTKFSVDNYNIHWRSLLNFISLNNLATMIFGLQVVTWIGLDQNCCILLLSKSSSEIVNFDWLYLAENTFLVDNSSHETVISYNAAFRMKYSS